MTYYFYENWQAHGPRAKVHHAECGFCNNGRGVNPEAGEEHGKWHGPYETVKDATGDAIATGADVSPCKHCNPC